MLQYEHKRQCLVRMQCLMIFMYLSKGSQRRFFLVNFARQRARQVCGDKILHAQLIVIYCCYSMNNICSVDLGFHLERKLSFLPAVAQLSREGICLMVLTWEIITCIVLQSVPQKGIFLHGFSLQPLIYGPSFLRFHTADKKSLSLGIENGK